MCTRQYSNLIFTLNLKGKLEESMTILEGVLRHDPKNELAKTYYSSISEKFAIQRKERETFKIDDNTKVILSKKKKTEEFSGLILGDEDIKSSHHYRKKERKFKD
jgi:hypothetical protein